MGFDTLSGPLAGRFRVAQCQMRPVMTIPPHPQSLGEQADFYRGYFRNPHLPEIFPLMGEIGRVALRFWEPAGTVIRTWGERAPGPDEALTVTGLESQSAISSLQAGLREAKMGSISVSFAHTSPDPELRLTAVVRVSGNPLYVGALLVHEENFAHVAVSYPEQLSSSSIALIISCRGIPRREGRQDEISFFESNGFLARDKGFQRLQYGGSQDEPFTALGVWDGRKRQMRFRAHRRGGSNSFFAASSRSPHGTLRTRFTSLFPKKS